METKQEFTMEKVFQPNQVESRIYDMWEHSGAFRPVKDESKKPFVIVMPPPNITGQLHIGHALDEMPQDVLIRYHRMKGDPTLWVPGTDHAAIATEVRVLDALRKEGLTKDMIGREAFLKRTWDWKKEYGGRIVKQLRKLGVSCDWDRERFTMDEGLSRAVRETFVRLYEKDLIYRGYRMINWCPCCKSSLSDIEVEYETKDGHFWHILYPVKETGELLELATTRPETMLGDTAVAINPEDPRYAHLHGCHVILPLIDKEIPIVCDEHADMEKGTGVVKITPAHDPNDFEVGKRHDLPMVRVFTYDGHMTGAEEARKVAELIASGRAAKDEPEVLDCGKYAGMTTDEARKAILEDLKALGLLKSVEPLQHEVGTCYRCHTTLEPMVSLQWFVKMQPLAEPACQVVYDGKLRFIPDRFEKTYLHWMENTRDWCISRQLWWGHRIPAYYCDLCGETIVDKQMPEVCPKCGCRHFTQDPDTLDTWFSSALWPFSTLGWPEMTEDLKYFYPTDVLVTGYDIIFFWVIRMIFSGFEQMGERPFKAVLFHGLVRDSQGRKMSKSLGNGIDPLQVIADYGADALRMTLITGNAPGNDMRFYDERVIANRNFANKVWNASRFIMMNLPEEGTEDDALLRAMIDKDLVPDAIAPEDKWILSRLNDTVQAVTENMNKYELGIAVQKVYDFMWDEFCDWYIEMVKPRLYKADDRASRLAALWTLLKVLVSGLKLLHPYMPFITEEIFTTVQSKEESIMISSWPVARDDFSFPHEEEAIENIKDAVRAVRAVRNERKVAPSRKAKIFVVSDKEEVLAMFRENQLFFETLASASDTVLCKDKAEVPEGALSVILPYAALYLPLADLMDVSAEIERLMKEEKRLMGELKRSAGMLSNEKFLAKAPASKIEAEREKQKAYEEQMKGVREELENLKKL